jgi:Uma2 family endonuclease
MVGSIIIDEQIEIPMDLASLDGFRRWALSDGFPQRGRIDFVAGKVEVDMSPEDLFCHGKLKIFLVVKLFPLVESSGAGHLFSDSTRVSSHLGDLSVEPDIVFVSHQSLESGRVKLTPKAGDNSRYVEIEGAPDLIVEIVSDSSVTKDTERLPQAYARAGVREFWLADARKEPLVFEIYHLVGGSFRQAEAGLEGFLRSEVFEHHFRLDGQRDADGFWKFDLVERKGS